MHSETAALNVVAEEDFEGKFKLELWKSSRPVELYNDTLS